MLYKMQDFTGNVSQSATIYEGHPISNENKQYDLRIEITILRLYGVMKNISLV